MERSFGFDVLARPRSAGRMTLVALIRDAAVVGRILRHLGLPDAVPAPRALATELNLKIAWPIAAREVCREPAPAFLTHSPAEVVL